MAAPVMPSPLRDGDRMGREEFLRRWDQMPDLKHAELIDGVVYMPSPVSRTHGGFHSIAVTWLTTYAGATPGSSCETECTWLMGMDSPQPDASLRLLPEYGGQCRYDGKLLAGAPELAFEIAASSKARDLGPKARLYARSGVRDYLTLLADESRVVWWELHGQRYEPLTIGPDGIFRSNMFPGLWLNGDALLGRDVPGVLAVLHQGLATAEHSEFVAALAARKQPA